MYEVEIKIELTEKEKGDLITEFKAKNFEFKGLMTQNDFYLEAKKSPHGGRDLKRLRSQDRKYIYTEKIWELSGDTKVRRENEHEVSEEEFNSMLLQFPDALKIIKDREWYAGSFQNKNISLTIDNVKFDHISLFLKELLNKEDLVEAPGMFAMAFDKK